LLVLTTRLLFAVVFVPMVVEACIAAVNERAVLKRGGLEAEGDVYRAMRVAYPAVFLLMIGEGALWPGHDRVAIGLAIFIFAKLLKSWAIWTLGDAWTFRVITLTGRPLVASGPYRWLRHPNYVGVAGELVGVALMSGARVTGPIGAILFGLLMRKRISVEERALDASARSI
jgi:methyltransferase